MSPTAPKNLLFIGAGASFGARTVGTDQQTPPLGIDLLHFLRTNTAELGKRVLTSSHIACSYVLQEATRILAAQITEPSFEKFLPLLEPDQREYIHRAIQFLFSDLKPEIDLDLGFARYEDGYDQLITKAGIRPGAWAVISLNYDLLLEDALTRLGVPFYYPAFPFGVNGAAPKDSLAVYKPHGSINFFAQPDHQIRFGGLPEIGAATTHYRNGEGGLRPNYPIVIAGMGGPANVIGRVSQQNTYPVIANYTAGKDVDVNQPALVQVRREAIDAAGADSSLLMVGVNPVIDRTDDPFCAELLSLKFSSMTCVGMGLEFAELVREHFPSATIFSEGFAKYLAAISR